MPVVEGLVRGELHNALQHHDVPCVEGFDLLLQPSRFAIEQRREVSVIHIIHQSPVPGSLYAVYKLLSVPLPLPEAQKCLLHQIFSKVSALYKVTTEVLLRMCASLMFQPPAFSINPKASKMAFLSSSSPPSHIRLRELAARSGANFNCAMRSHKSAPSKY